MESGMAALVRRKGSAVRSGSMLVVSDVPQPDFVHWVRGRGVVQTAPYTLGIDSNTGLKIGQAHGEIGILDDVLEPSVRKSRILGVRAMDEPAQHRCISNTGKS